MNDARIQAVELNYSKDRKYIATSVEIREKMIDHEASVTRRDVFTGQNILRSDRSKSSS